MLASLPARAASKDVKVPLLQAPKQQVLEHGWPSPTRALRPSPLTTTVLPTVSLMVNGRGSAAWRSPSPMVRSVTLALKVKVTAVRAGLAAVLHAVLVVSWMPPAVSSVEL